MNLEPGAVLHLDGGAFDDVLLVLWSRGSFWYCLTLSSEPAPSEDGRVHPWSELCLTARFAKRIG